LGGLGYGRALALGASAAILVIAGFAALNELQIATPIVNGLFYALLAIVVGSAIVAIGGGGIQTMSRYWERAATRAELESSNIKQEAEGSTERIQQRARERAQQFKDTGGGSESGAVRSPQ
jgi:hypothetical protein